MAKMPNRKMKFKLNIVILGFLALCFLIVAIRTIFIACFGGIDGVKYGIKAKNRQMSTNVVRANRGTIYDRNMVPLAQSATVWIVTISPNQFKSDEQKEKVFEYLCDMFEIQDREKIHKRFYSKRKYEIIKKEVEKPEVDKLLEYIKKNKLQNIVNIEEDTKRYYPLKNLASHTIGFVGADNQGLLGLELFYDKVLAGENGKLLRIQDAKGGPMPYEFENLYPAKNGNSIVISIDSKIQRVCEEALLNLHKWHKPNNRCLAIVMKVDTGEILALAINPSFDLNDPFAPPDIEKFPAIENLSEKDQKAANWKNKAVSETYEPGSVFKVLTASAALEEKVASLNKTFHCGGSVTIQGERMKCWKTSGHGAQNFTQICVNSCNPAFVALGLALGAKRFNKYLNYFGITKKTNIDLPGEMEAIYHREKNLQPVSLASQAFGQSLSITPIQMIRTFSAVVNGGFLYRPFLLKQILDSKGNIIKTQNKKVVNQPISKATSETMRTVLTEVVKGPEGKGTNASVAGIPVAGKTGTAQILRKRNKTGKDFYVSSFAGVLSAIDPRVAILVAADEPTMNGYYGNVVASPIFNQIASKIAPYLGITPTYTDEQLEQFFNKVIACEGMPAYKAKQELNNSKFNNVKIVGDKEDSVIAQLPESGLNISKDSIIYLYTDEDSLKENTISVPDINSMSFNEAKDTLSSSGLNMVLDNIATNYDNHSKAIEQFPEPGTKVSKGSTVEVKFQMYDGTG